MCLCFRGPPGKGGVVAPCSRAPASRKRCRSHFQPGPPCCAHVDRTVPGIPGLPAWIGGLQQEVPRPPRATQKQGSKACTFGATCPGASPQHPPVGSGEREAHFGGAAGRPERILQLCTQRLPVQAVRGLCGAPCGTGQGTPSSRQAAQPGQRSPSQTSASTSVSCRVKDPTSELLCVAGSRLGASGLQGLHPGMLPQADQAASRAKAQERTGRGWGVRGGGLDPMGRRAHPSPSAGAH